MSSLQIALLGVIAGCTIFLGLPFGRVRAPLRWTSPTRTVQCCASWPARTLGRQAHSPGIELGSGPPIIYDQAPTPILTRGEPA